MAKQKAKKKDKADSISDLLELAEKVNLPEGFFDGDVEDECVHGARETAKKINGGCLMDQLEYLVDSGYPVGRLEELIREGGITPNNE